MSYEWDEEIPQPKPPTNKVRLAVQTWCVEKYDPESGRNEPENDWGKARAATHADIARALGVTEVQLACFIDATVELNKRRETDERMRAINAISGVRK